MFGYIRACKPEMRIKEYELYKAVYCSLCKEMGKTYGILSRFTLSYDFTFYALLGMALKTDCCSIQQKSCTCNPLKKCQYLSDLNDMKMPAAASMILCYFKLIDNINDEKGFKRLKYIFAKPFISSAYKNAFFIFSRSYFLLLLSSIVSKCSIGFNLSSVICFSFIFQCIMSSAS